MNEKMFTIEKNFNKQNDKIYAQILYMVKAKVPRIQRGRHPSSVVVGLGVS